MTQYKAITHKDCSSDWQKALGNPGIRRVLAQLSCRFRLLIWEIRVEDAPGQVPGLPFIAKGMAPRAPGGADAAVVNLHHPGAEEIRPGLDAVVPQAAAGGIAGFEGDAEVEHGRGKGNDRIPYRPPAPVRSLRLPDLASKVTR
jgi:hypothetical protein